MNILYHHRTQGKGAEGVHIREIINGLNKLDCEVRVVSPPGVDLYPADNRAEHKKSTALGGLWKAVGKFSPQLVFELCEIFYNFIGLYNLKKVLRRKNIDFIYERNAFFCWAGVSVAKKYRIPIILEVNEVSGIGRVRGQVLKSLAKTIEMKNFKKADAIIVVSRFLKEHIVNSFGIDPNKIFIVPNAVNPDEFNIDSRLEDHSLNDCLSNRGVIIGFVGGFVRWHNFELLFDALRQIVNEGIIGICLLLVGDGPLKKDIMRMIEDSGLTKYVLFTGYVRHKIIPAYINAMDICVIPHSNAYRSPIKLFEYMAMAKPVVAPRLEPIEAIIKDDVSGKLFEAQNRQSLRDCLVDLITHKDKREMIGREARQVILSNHLWIDNARKILSAYNKVR